MKVVSLKGEHDVVIIDRRQLDSVDNAFRQAKEIDAQQGGAFETWADVNVYKGAHKINLFVQHSIYNGWMIEVGNKTLSSQYLFELVSRYSKK